jgi:zinc protease
MVYFVFRIRVQEASKTLKITILLLFALFLGLIPSNSSGQAFKNASEVRLSNGLKIILLENHKSPMVTFQVWYRAGSRNERVGKTGLAHLLEHMMFKGTKKVSGEEFTKTISDNGGEENAFTSHDFAAYFETLSSDRIGISLTLESDRMANLILRESDFQTERLVVIEERRMRTDDNPQAFLLEQLDAAAYQSQPYHWPVVGWPADIERITLGDVQDFYSSYYNPSNAFIVVVGDFKKEFLIPEIEKAFGGIPGGPARQQFMIQDPPQSGEKRIVVERPAQVGSLIIGYHVPNVRNPDSYVLEVIRAILSEGKSSRFYEKLVRKGLALEATADYSPATQDPSLFYVMASVLPDKNMADVEKAFHEELERLKTTPVDSEVLEKAKNQLEAAFVFDQDSIFSLGKNLAQYEIASEWQAIDKYIQSIRNVSGEDIMRVATRYLTVSNRNVGILTPVGSPEEAPSQPPMGMKDKGMRLR